MRIIKRELLIAYMLTSIHEPREKSEEWRIDYNTERPHKSPGYQSPINFTAVPKKLKTSTNAL